MRAIDETRLAEQLDGRQRRPDGRRASLALSSDGSTLTLSAHPSREGLHLVDYRLGGGRASGYVTTRPMVETSSLAPLPRGRDC